MFEGREKLNEIERKAFNKKFKAAYLHPCETYWIRTSRVADSKKVTIRKKAVEGGAGHVYTDEQKAKISAMHGQYEPPTKPVTRCEILEDGETHQKSD